MTEEVINPLAARNSADFRVAAGEADELNLVEHHVFPIDRRAKPRRLAVLAAITRPRGPGIAIGPKSAGVSPADADLDPPRPQDPSP